MTAHIYTECNNITVEEAGHKVLANYYSKTQVAIDILHNEIHKAVKAGELFVQVERVVNSPSNANNILYIALEYLQSKCFIIDPNLSTLHRNLITHFNKQSKLTTIVIKISR